MRNLLPLLILLLTATVMRADQIKQGSFQAHSDGENVTLYWMTEDESNVLRFEIERRMGTDGTWLSIGAADAKGVSMYEFVDYSAFRKTVTVYQYRIKIVFSNGASPVYVGPLTVSHAVSGVRRTWGSIKALFR